MLQPVFCIDLFHTTGFCLIYFILVLILFIFVLIYSILFDSVLIYLICVLIYFTLFDFTVIVVFVKRRDSRSLSSLYRSAYEGASEMVLFLVAGNALML